MRARARQGKNGEDRHYRGGEHRHDGGAALRGGRSRGRNRNLARTGDHTGPRVGDRPNARAVTVEEAARFGEVVMEAIPFGRYTDLPADARVRQEPGSEVYNVAMTPHEAREALRRGGG